MSIRWIRQRLDLKKEAVLKIWRKQRYPKIAFAWLLKYFLRKRLGQFHWMMLIVPTLFSMKFKDFEVSNFLIFALIHDKLSKNQKNILFFCDLESVGRISPSKFLLKLRTYTQKLSGISMIFKFYYRLLNYLSVDLILCGYGCKN